MKSNALCVVILMFGLCVTVFGVDIVTFTFKSNGQPEQTFIVEMPDGSLDQAIEAFATIYQRPDKIMNDKGVEIDNPISKQRFMASKIREFCVEVTKAHAIQTAQKVAAEKANTEFKKLENAIQVKTGE